MHYSLKVRTLAKPSVCPPTWPRTRPRTLSFWARTKLQTLYVRAINRTALLMSFSDLLKDTQAGWMLADVWLNQRPWDEGQSLWHSCLFSVLICPPILPVLFTEMTRVVISLQARTFHWHLLLVSFKISQSVIEVILLQCHFSIVEMRFMGYVATLQLVWMLVQWSNNIEE